MSKNVNYARNSTKKMRRYDVMPKRMKMLDFEVDGRRILLFSDGVVYADPPNDEDIAASMVGKVSDSGKVINALVGKHGPESAALHVPSVLFSSLKEHSRVIKEVRDARNRRTPFFPKDWRYTRLRSLLLDVDQKLDSKHKIITPYNKGDLPEAEGNIVSVQYPLSKSTRIVNNKILLGLSWWGVYKRTGGLVYSNKLAKTYFVFAMRGSNQFLILTRPGDSLAKYGVHKEIAGSKFFAGFKYLIREVKADKLNGRWVVV